MVLLLIFMDVHCLALDPWLCVPIFQRVCLFALQRYPVLLKATPFIKSLRDFIAKIMQESSVASSKNLLIKFQYISIYIPISFA